MRSVLKEEYIYRDVAIPVRLFRYLWLGFIIFSVWLMGWVTPDSLYGVAHLSFLLLVPYVLSILVCRMSRVAGLVLVAFGLFILASLAFQTYSAVVTPADQYFGGLKIDPVLFFLSVGISGLYFVYVALWFVRGGYRMLTSTNETRLRVAEVYTRTWPFSLKSISSALGLPFSIRHLRKRGSLVLGCFFISAAGFAALAIVMYFLPVSLPQVLMAHASRDAFNSQSFDKLREQMHSDSPVGEGEPPFAFDDDDPAGEDAGAETDPGFTDQVEPFDIDPVQVSLEFNGSIALLGLVGFLVGASFQRIGKRLARQSLVRTQADDVRPPILFLRSFADDQVKLRPPKVPWLARLYGVADRGDTLDVVCLEEGTDYGPVVALGNPNDPVPPYGAARGYFEHADWKEGVKSLATSSSAIVLCIDDSEGVWWEVEHIMGSPLKQKTLVLFHPKVRDAELRKKILSRFSAYADHGLADVLSTPEVLGFFYEGDVLQTVVSKRMTRSSYLILTRWFLRSRFGPAS